MNVCDARVIMLKKKVALKIVGHFGHMWRECRLLDGSPHSQTFHLNLSSSLHCTLMHFQQFKTSGVGSILANLGTHGTQYALSSALKIVGPFGHMW